MNGKSDIKININILMNLLKTIDKNIIWGREGWGEGVVEGGERGWHT